MPVEKRFKLRPGYTFTPVGDLMHEDSLDKLQKLLDRAQKRDPDAAGLYIYNDFFGYALLDLVDKTLSSIHTLAVKKKWVETWYLLVALSEFMERCPEWTQIDDGEHVDMTDKCYGALLISTIRGLDSSTPSQFTETVFQDLEKSLEGMASWGDVMEDLFERGYNKVIRGYGKKLFGGRTDEERQTRKAEVRKAYEAFYKNLSENEKAAKGYLSPSAVAKQQDEEDDEGEDDGEDKENDAERGGLWFGKAKVKDAEYDSKDFKMGPVWKEYKAYLAGDTSIPFRGPPEWDLSKWTIAEKQAFSLDGP